MNGIDAQPRTVRELLSKRKYDIDEYQREYRWTKDNIEELLNDLAAQFAADYQATHERHEVERYRDYFLGSVVMSRRDGRDYIVDGQQRITSLTLLLIFLHHKQNASALEHATNVEDLIFSVKYGRRSFNLDVPERRACLEALYSAEPFDATDKDESVQTMVQRYADIDEIYPDTLRGEALSYFVDWLLEKVWLIEISTSSDDDAYTIFETMNDRGQPLSPTDMLKGYLLSRIAVPDDRTRANQTWRDCMVELRTLGNTEDTDFMKHLLRARYAETIREHRKAAENRDFEMIGTGFHKWVRGNRERIGLHTSDDFDAFIRTIMVRYTREYIRIRRAAEQLTTGLEVLFYNAANNFTLQYPVLLAALRPEDDRATVDRKIRMIATFLDIFIARRAVNYYELKYSAMVSPMFAFMRAIRNTTVPELHTVLRQWLDVMECDFGGSKAKDWRQGMADFYLNNWSKKYIHVLLARLTAHVEMHSGMPNNFPAYINRATNNPFEIEHIWSNHFGEHTEEFDHPEDFQWVRNKIGGLLLLPRKFNRSFGDLPYEKKRQHYLGQNLLARSLHEQCYERNPGFLQYIATSGQPFQAHKNFNRADLEQRQTLYRSLCEEVWHPSRIDQAAEM